MMRRKKLFGLFFMVLTAVVLSTAVSTQAVAGQLFWCGSGTWNATNSNWATAPYSTFNTGWVDGSRALFFVGGTATIADGFTPEVAGITFQANCLITGSSLTLTNKVISGASVGTISSAIAGNAGLEWSGNGTLTLAGDNTYSGVTNAMSSIKLASAGSMLMDINAGGDCSYFTSTSSSLRQLKLDGTLKFDVADVTGDSDSWLLVNGNLTANYGSTFAVTFADGTPFTEVSNVWTCESGARSWTYTESTGVLNFVAVPEPSSLVLLVCGLAGLLAYAWRKRK